jgi:hypothetical protein
LAGEVDDGVRGRRGHRPANGDRIEQIEGGRRIVRATERDRLVPGRGDRRAHVAAGEAARARDEDAH